MKRWSRRPRWSAEPVDDVEARLPCYARYALVCKLSYNVFPIHITLITLAPAPAATIAVVVLTLKVLPISSHPNDIHHEILVMINGCRDHSWSQQACGNDQ